MKPLTDKEILEACARAMEYEGGYLFLAGGKQGSGFPYHIEGFQLVGGSLWNPLKNSGECFRMENKCGVTVECKVGRAHFKYSRKFEHFTTGNDEQRRRASCLVVARAQIGKEKSK